MTTAPSWRAATAGASYLSASADIGGCLSVGGLHSQRPSRGLGGAIGDPPKPSPNLWLRVFRDSKPPITVDSDGYVGFAVHRAARLGDLGDGGQMLPSRTTAALVEHELPADIRVRDLGETKLPGLDRPEAVFQCVADDLPERFPPIGARRTS